MKSKSSGLEAIVKAIVKQAGKDFALISVSSLLLVGTAFSIYHQFKPAKPESAKELAAEAGYPHLEQVTEASRYWIGIAHDVEAKGILLELGDGRKLCYQASSLNNNGRPYSLRKQVSGGGADFDPSRCAY